jgi:hypothetical protein
MNSQTEKVFSNENLLIIIISFLSINDIINLTSTNKKIQKKQNKIFNEICKKIYTSSYDEYSILNQLLENNNQRKNEELNYLNSKINWRRFLLCGKQIEFLYKNLNVQNIISFKEDSKNFQIQLYSILKGKFKFYFFYFRILVNPTFKEKKFIY